MKLVQTDNETCVDGVPLRFIDGLYHRFGLKYVRFLEIEDVRGSGLKDGSYEYEYYVRLLFTGLRDEGAVEADVFTYTDVNGNQVWILDCVSMIRRG